MKPEAFAAIGAEIRKAVAAEIREWARQSSEAHRGGGMFDNGVLSSLIELMADSDEIARKALAELAGN